MAGVYEHPSDDDVIVSVDEQPSLKGTCVTVQTNGKSMSAEYSELTGQLCLRQDGVMVQEWFPPHSWFAIASVAGASSWGTQPSAEDLHALIRNELMARRG
ncbi:UNVERIFIED_ORG: hypothetical protein BDU10_7714 [Burkholderia sp. CF145]|jgi:hypothetical protein|uniref:hypothetical protein n=1 Tax=Paraburkholderia hospita TaxID=169430 RepID=UPI0002716141|nr:hypothetical protein [Paraburkholderia hospita]EUC18488.1 hypothetical protein PMI06_000074 [Burkholderia sp. BT03]SKD00053.1 hypothetical protein SAMN05445504_7942 [Burkholderia sp. CF099]SKD04226.1 hypothetical protein SAMN06266956_8667 [Paraburkholderia hospita]